MDGTAKQLVSGEPDHIGNRNTSEAAHLANLNDGVGEPWAGQARLNGRADFSVKTNPELFSENFGADPPTGSEIYIV